VREKEGEIGCLKETISQKANQVSTSNGLSGKKNLEWTISTALMAGSFDLLQSEAHSPNKCKKKVA
jgi:hypothetical protein